MEVVEVETELRTSSMSGALAFACLRDGTIQLTYPRLSTLPSAALLHACSTSSSTSATRRTQVASSRIKPAIHKNRYVSAQYRFLVKPTGGYTA